MRHRSLRASVLSATGFLIFLSATLWQEASPRGAIGGHQLTLLRTCDRPSQGTVGVLHRAATLAARLSVAPQGETLLFSKARSAYPSPPQGSLPSFLVKEQTIFEDEIAAHSRGEAQALRALAAGVQALADTESKGNLQTENASEVSR